MTLFAEQANVLQLDQPYRQRLLRLWHPDVADSTLYVQYYGFKHPEHFKGAGQNPDLIKQITLEQIEQLSGCVLKVTQPDAKTFAAFPPPNTNCYFTYQGEKRQVSLGFEASSEEFKSYDKGINPETGEALWGAVLGPYQFIKQREYLHEFSD